MLKIPSYISRITNTKTPRVFRITSEEYEVKTLADLRDFRLARFLKVKSKKKKVFETRAEFFAGMKSQ